jgi:hypothetical protein
VDELLGLASNGGDDGRVAVAKLADRDAAKEVQVFVAPVVPKGA